MIVLDDLGFAQLGCFGSDIATPHIDALAAGGLRYNRFHVTRCARRRAPACSPGATTTRSAWASSPTSPSASPATTARIPPLGRHAAAHPARRRLQHVRGRQVAPRAALGADARRGRSTAGRSASASSATTASSAATPTSGRRSWCADNDFVEPPRPPDEGYHLTEDLADQAIRFVHDQQQATPGKPFFLYFATGAMHAPHHVAPEWIERYRGPLRRRLGGVARRARSPASASSASCPTARALHRRARSWVAAWDGLLDRRAPALRPA